MSSASYLGYVWFIPGLPLASFIVLLVFGKRLKSASAYLSIAAIAGSWLASLLALMAVRGGIQMHVSLPWLAVKGMGVRLGLALDPLAAVMLVVVTSVSLAVQFYSTEYMSGDKRFGWYYAALSLFTFSMLVLVLADNYLQLYLAWELVGLCSYFLIGFWFEKKAASDAGKKAFITTKIGDVGFFLGMVALFGATGTFAFADIFAKAEAHQIAPGIITLTSVLLFCGAVGKSAQFPLHVWLPDAMEGPTPVSALIHAATMVAAGVYLVARSFPLFEQSPQAMLVVACVGAFTAIFAASMGLVQRDIKRILAYSTISQLGYMMAGLGVGAYTAAVFHLVTHAFFKSLLFLGAGSVIHAAHSQDIFDMGGLLRKMKVTTIAFMVGALALAGVPPFSGFWSKDEILTEALAEGNQIVFAVLLITAVMTAFYISRLCFVAFFGSPEKVSKAHESSAAMTGPLVILALMAAGIGLVGSPFSGYAFQSFLTGGNAEVHANYTVMGVSTLAGFLGIVLAAAVYLLGMLDHERMRETLGPVYRTLYHKYYVDEIYQAVFIRPAIGVARVFLTADKYVIDGVVNLAAWLTNGIGSLLKYVQTGQEQTYARLTLVGLLVFFFYALRMKL